MQYTQTTITINGKTVTHTTTSNNTNNSTKKPPKKKDFLRELNGDYYFGLFGDIHPIDYNNKAWRALMWLEFILLGWLYFGWRYVLIGLCFLVAAFFALALIL
jgi:hypothetical protein